MIDMYYAFPDRETMITRLKQLNMVYADSEGISQVVSTTHSYCAVEVGQMPPTSMWHLNIRQIKDDIDLSSLEPYRVYPVKPVNMWA